ncbi:hypothetical protein, partial [Marivita sp.]|uniref:hypothetical protein n=1 Tax=Marivita sp. TaxID=2003365 RepID=UPI0025BB8AE3
RSFVGTKVFNGYDCLIDGFSRQFDPSNLDRRVKSRQSFYLHLHGSPLYYTGIDGSLNKGSLSSIKQLEGHASLHLVLTHVKHKMSVIAASPILKEYWLRLEEAMSEVDCLILFGYSGADAHLNSLVERHFSSKDVHIVERKHIEYDTELGKSERFDFWTKKIGTAKKVCFWMDNILDFNRWPYEHNWS